LTKAKVREPRPKASIAIAAISIHVASYASFKAVRQPLVVAGIFSSFGVVLYIFYTFSVTLLNTTITYKCG
jgi:hypothetical protein